MFIIKLVNRVALDSTSRSEQWFWKGCKPPARPPNGPEDSAMVSWCLGWLVGTWGAVVSDTLNINKHIRKKYVACCWRKKNIIPPLHVFFWGHELDRKHWSTGCSISGIPRGFATLPPDLEHKKWHLIELQTTHVCFGNTPLKTKMEPKKLIICRCFSFTEGGILRIFRLHVRWREVTGAYQWSKLWTKKRTLQATQGWDKRKGKDFVKKITTTTTLPKFLINWGDMYFRYFQRHTSKDSKFLEFEKLPHV